MDVRVPADLWEGDGEGVLTAWLFDDGATVAKGALLAEVMSDKTQHELEAPAAGTLRIQKAVDDVVHKGDVIGTIDAG